MEPPVLTLVVQAAAEYLGLVMANAARSAEAWAWRAAGFLSTPKGVLIAALGVILLAYSLGRKRSF